MARQQRQSRYKNSESEYFWLSPRTVNQKHLVQEIRENKIVLVKGPPGCGKTVLTLQEAIRDLNQGFVRKIYYLRNNCETDGLGSKGRGEIPGTVLEKAMPLLGPILDNLLELMPEGKAKYMIEKSVIEPLYYEDLRGRSLNEAFIIGDEAQSVTPKGVKTLLTRIGRDSKIVLLGDVKQKDTSSRYDDGLSDAYQRLRGLQDVGFVELGLQDIQRNSVITEILRRYGDY